MGFRQSRTKTPMAISTESQRLNALRSAPLNSWVALSEDESRIVATGASYQSFGPQRCSGRGQSRHHQNTRQVVSPFCLNTLAALSVQELPKSEGRI